MFLVFVLFFFFFNDTATTEIYTLSLHDALPILVSLVTIFGIVGLWAGLALFWGFVDGAEALRFFYPFVGLLCLLAADADRKSTRLNSSHLVISYAVFCLKKKNASHNLMSIVYAA